MSVNHGVREGRLTRDPEIRNVKDTCVCNFSIAINRKFKNKTTGQMENDATFLDCVAWDKGAETIHKYFRKGDPIIIEESLQQESWVDKTSGVKRSKLVARVERFHFVSGHKYGGGDGSGEAGPEKANTGTSPANEPALAGVGAGAGEDDIPF